MNGSLKLTSTEPNKPAVLILQDISEEGLFTTNTTNGTIILNNLDIRGKGRGIFLRNVSEIEINNCYVRNYDITDSSTRFIEGANNMEISKTGFYNNTVHSTTSSVISPAYVIGTNNHWKVEK